MLNGPYIKLKLLKSCILDTIFKELNKRIKGTEMLKTLRGNLPCLTKLRLFSYF